MQTKHVDYINIGLILLSAILAYHFPLELFIVAFITLGPLHYFTEINWLDKKNYFTSAPKRSWLWLGLLATVLVMFPKFYFFFSEERSGSTYEFIVSFNRWTNAFIFLSLIGAAGFVLIKKRVYWVVLLVPSIVIAYFLNTKDTYMHLVGILLPTVIHVYIFTLLFMAYGAKKSKSTPGYISVGIAVFIPIIFAGLDINEQTFLFSDSMKDFYLGQGFHVPTVRTAQFIGLTDGKSFFFYQPLFLKMMMFMSFIYLYHYLNWFSKTSLIQWHKTLTWQRSVIIAVIWIALLTLFYYNLPLGILFAVTFSMLHVVLEFPLNVFSVKGLLQRDKTENPDQ